MSFGDYQLEIYLQGLTGVLPSLPMVQPRRSTGQRRSAGYRLPA
jgi:hypothetical protein